MRIIPYVVVLVIICTVLISCNGNRKDDPLLLDVEREPQAFLDDPVMLFGEDFDATFPESVYCEVDIGGAVQASESSSLSGNPVNTGSPGYWGSAVVTLMRDEDDANRPFKPVARWMSDDGSAELSDSFYVTGWEAGDPNNNIFYKHPKCASLAYSYNSVDYVELAVTYQMRGLPAGDIEDQIGPGWFNETNNDEWDIGLTILTWEVADIPDPDDAVRQDFFIPGIQCKDQA